MHDIIFIKFLLNLVNNVEKWKILNWLEIGFMLRAELCLNDIFVSHSTSSSSLLIKQRKRGRKEGEQQQNTIERGEWNFSCKQERRRMCPTSLTKRKSIWWRVFRVWVLSDGGVIFLTSQRGLSEWFMSSFWCSHRRSLGQYFDSEFQSQRQRV